MKKFLFILTVILTMFVSVEHAAGRSASSLPVPYDVRVYLNSVQNALMGESAWKSNAQLSKSTSSYVTTQTIYLTVSLVDSDNVPMYWFNGDVGSFSVSSTASVTGVTHGASLTTSTLSFDAGSAGCGIILTGVWAVGNTITVSAPLLSDFVSTVSAGSVQVVSFTTN